jgi:ribosomal protein L12E/L44/L45/RPP1/RPP2
MPRLLWTELALDNDERHALVRHLDGVGVAELVRREATPDPRAAAAVRLSSARAAAGDNGGRESRRS